MIARAASLPVSLRWDRPVRSSSTPEPETSDTVEPFASPQKPSSKGLGAQALAAASGACRAALFGPVAHCVGKVVCTLGKTPQYRKPNIPPSQLGPLPSASIQRPLVFVPGWHTHIERFGPIGQKLTENGGNGGQVAYVQKGQFFSDPTCQQPLANPGQDMKVFVSVLTSNRLAPDEAQPELSQNLAAIKKVTGQDRLDVTAFSMGGLATRLYVDQNEDHGLGKVMFIATPQQGSGLAGLSLGLLDGKARGWDTQWLLVGKDVREEDRWALEWLRPSSQPRSDLNSRWPKQRDSLEGVLHLGAGSRTTVGTKLSWPGKGDGMVPVASLALEGLPVEVLKDQTSKHGELIQSPEVYLRMRDYFGWS